ncbi:MAG: LamG domain-containing protein [Pirellulaceae bacterium]|nr:LamG domain-containing protein [Pirellulaceae bacterium]
MTSLSYSLPICMRSTLLPVTGCLLLILLPILGDGTRALRAQQSTLSHVAGEQGDPTSSGFSGKNSLSLNHGLISHWPVVCGNQAIAEGQTPRFGRGDFSISLWFNSDPDRSGQSADLISQYDPKLRRGFHLTLKSNSGATSNQANWRHLQFGLDDNRLSSFVNCGRPGNALLAFALAVHDGQLYAGTCEPGAGQCGHVFRYNGQSGWTDCGSLDGSNSVTALAVYDHALYAGTGKYRVAGSSLPESPNEQLGGRVYRYDATGQIWIDCGQLPDTQAVGGLVVFQDRLYASSLYKPAGLFRYAGERRWESLPVPTLAVIGESNSSVTEQPARVVSLCNFEGLLYATSYDSGHVYRWDGAAWENCGMVGDNTQTYGFTVYQGKLLVSTWPSGRVYQFVGPNNWNDLGRLGEELEVMGLMVHNGRLFAGTLPLAQVYAYDGQQQWSLLQQLDQTPDVRYRRAWTMAEYDGRLFCSTLPSGQVYAWSQGAQVASGQSLSTDWHHVVAIRSRQELELWIDGQLAVRRTIDGLPEYDLSNSAPLTIASGMNAPLAGQIVDLRLYNRPLPAPQIAELAVQRPSATSGRLPIHPSNQ